MVKKFQCHICKKYFLRNYHLRKHQRNVHALANSEIFCEVCDESFTSANSLYNHNIQKHNVICDVCGKVFCSEAAMKRHKRDHFNSGKNMYASSFLYKMNSLCMSV